jgi:hypothetical protein
VVVDLELALGRVACPCRLTMRWRSNLLPVLMGLLGESLEAVEREVTAVVGGEEARPRSENLMDMAPELFPSTHIGVLVKAREQHGFRAGHWGR